MVNDKEWERRSDEWVKSMNESKLLKKERLAEKIIHDKAGKYTLIGSNPGRYSYAVKKPC